MRYNIERLVCTVHTFCIGPLIVAINMSEFLYIVRIGLALPDSEPLIKGRGVVSHNFSTVDPMSKTLWFSESLERDLSNDFSTLDRGLVI